MKLPSLKKVKPADHDPELMPAPTPPERLKTHAQQGWRCETCGAVALGPTCEVDGTRRGQA